MRKIGQEDFDKMTFSVDVKECNHAEVVRLYTMGSNTDYGCLCCGLQHTNIDVFSRPGLGAYR